MGLQGRAGGQQRQGITHFFTKILVKITWKICQGIVGLRTIKVKILVITATGFFQRPAAGVLS